MKTPETIRVTPAIHAVVAQVIPLALRFEDLTGRKLGVSANVGEILVASKLGLRLMKSDIEQGYDAFDTSGKRVQIKVRRSEAGRGREIPSSTSRTGRFSEHPYDYALLAILTRDYGLHEIYRATRASIEASFRGRTRRDLSIGKFQKIGRKIYP